MKKTLLFFSLFIIFLSCRNKQEQVDCIIHIPEVSLYITTSKRVGGDFYIIFSQKDSLAVLSKNIDYVKFKTEEIPINIISDPEKKNDIYILNSFGNSIKTINDVKFQFHELNSQEYDSLFFETRTKTNPPRLKETYIHLYLHTMSYAIDLNGVRIKKGTLHGS